MRTHVDLPDGAKLSVVVRKGQGPTLVLIPGSYSGAAYYDEMTPFLDASVHLIVLEMRGHGESRPPMDSGSMAQMTEDTVYVADALGLTTFFLGGASIGGMIAIDCLRVYEQRLLGVISIEGWTSARVHDVAFRDAKQRPVSATEEKKAREKRISDTEGWTDRQIKDFGAIWRNWEGYDLLSQTDTPVLEIWGDRNSPRPSREQMLIPDRPNIDLCWVENAYHTPQKDRPEEVARLINRFLSQHTS